jgi:signal transduction histidine kinase
MTTTANLPDPGMELTDLLEDTEFLNRKSGANRAENRLEAFRALSSVFAESSQLVLQRLVDIAVAFCAADSAGISLEEPEEKRFRWVAVSGSFAQYVNGTTPRFFSPCGTCLSTGRPQHYRVTKAYYDFLGIVAEPINDGILIPWESFERKGTIWAVSHGSRETFDLDDYLLLHTLADFAAISVRLSEREEALHQSHRELESQVLQRTASLRQLSAHLLRVQDHERRTIARELHDSLGQYLVALKMNLSRIEGHSAGNDAQILGDSINLLDQCLSETRTISHLLHPPLLDESGLRSAAQWYVEGFSKRSGIQVLLQIDEHLGRLPQDVETALFRVLQESLTNVHRHSGSKKVDIWIRLDRESVLATIRDYGRGLPSHQLPDVHEVAARGVGLTSLLERMAALGGLLEILSAEPGVLVRVRLPIPAPREKNLS